MSQYDQANPDPPFVSSRVGLRSFLRPAFAPGLPAARRSRIGLGCLGLLLLCLFAFFWRLGKAPLFDLDEALYVTCARQMVLSGDIVTPRLNSRPLYAPARTTVPFFEKPILVYWLCAAAMKAFGLSVGAARLPAACLALLAVGAIVWAGTRWFGARAGLLAGLVYALAPMTIVDARQMTTDGLLVLWFTGALLVFWTCHRRAEAQRRGTPADHGPLITFWLPMLFWGLCALAVLTKGAVGLLLPLLVIGVFLLVDRPLLRMRFQKGRRFPALSIERTHLADWRATIVAMRPAAGLLLFLALILPWHTLIWKAGGHDAEGRTFFQEYILRQHIGRFRGLDKVHNAPLPSYFAYFLLGFFPWAFFTPWAFRAGSASKATRNHRDAEARRIHGEEPETTTPQPTSYSLPSTEARQIQEAEPDVYRFLLVWFWTIFVFFSLGAAKLPTYIVPGYPAAALLMGRWLDRVLAPVTHDEFSPAVRALRRGALAASLTAALLLAAAVIAPHLLPAHAAVSADVQRLVLHVMLALLAGSLVAWLCFLLGGRGARWRWAGCAALAVVSLALVGIGCTEGYAVAASDLLGPYQRLAAAARPDAQAGLPVVYCHIIPRRPSMLYYGRYAPLERKETPLLPFLRPFLTRAHPAADVLTTRATYAGELSGELAAAPELCARVLASTERAGGWVLLRITRREAQASF